MVSGLEDPAPQSAAEMDVLVARIEKLWRKANDPSVTPAESEAFEAKALSLMERHRIEAAALDLEREDPLADVRYGSVEGRYSAAVVQIIEAVARAYGCRVWWWTLGYRKDVQLFGFRSDCERVRRIAQMLVADAMSQAALHRQRTAASTFELRRSFLLGYSAAIRERFAVAASIAAREAADADAAAASSGSLVLVARAEQVDEAYSKKHLRKASPTRASTRSGFDLGRAAGMQASTRPDHRIGPRREIG